MLEAYGKLGVELLRNAVTPFDATGKTKASIRYVATEDRLLIFGRQFFKALETGRGPRVSSEYSGFDNSLLEYINAKGIGSELDQKGKERLAKFMAYKINKEGDRTYKRGGRQVYSDELEKFIDELKGKVMKETVKKVSLNIKEWLSV